MANSNRYKEMMDKAKPPVHLPKKVIAQLDELRAAEPLSVSQQSNNPQQQRSQKSQQSAPPLQPNTRNPQSHTCTRIIRIAIGSCAAALAVGAIIAAPIFLSSSPESQDNPAITTPPDNPFGLALYASANEVGQTVDIAADESGIQQFSGNGFYAEGYLMNLTCTGNNISTITYTIEGEGVKFSQVNTETGSDGIEKPLSESYPTEFVFDYREQTIENVYRQIIVDTRPLDEQALEQRIRELSDQISDNPSLAEELDALREEMNQVNATHEAWWTTLPEDPEARNAALLERSRQLTYDTAQQLGRAALSATATFTDGSTLTKQYRIAPVENLEQVLIDRDAAHFDKAPDDDPRLTTPLFTITEID